MKIGLRGVLCRVVKGKGAFPLRVLTMNEVTIGCWVVTVWGPAVVTNMKEGRVSFRYEAVRSSDKETIWVANGSLVDEVRFLQEADQLSKHVLTLTGPYGEG